MSREWLKPWLLFFGITTPLEWFRRKEADAVCVWREAVGKPLVLAQQPGAASSFGEVGTWP